MIPDILLIENRQKCMKYYLLDIDATEKFLNIDISVPPSGGTSFLLVSVEW
jgi:hypothetical protein